MASAAPTGEDDAAVGLICFVGMTQAGYSESGSGVGVNVGVFRGRRIIL